MQEHRRSLLLTPLLIAAGLSVALLVSGLVTNRLGAMDDSALRVFLQQTDEDANVSIVVNSSDEQNPVLEYRVERPADDLPLDGSAVEPSAAQDVFQRVLSFNPMLNTIHLLLLWVLLLVSANYLLATFFSDRQDRSILFWKSMPVSEWEEALSRFTIVLLVAPALYIAASLLAQVVGILVAMFVAWRLELDPFEAVLGKIDVLRLMKFQLGGWPLLAVQVAPIYAWLLLASAFSKRSPFMTAVVPVVVMVVAERMLLGTQYLVAALTSHVPHFTAGADGLGGYQFPGALSMLLGILLAALLLSLAVYLRRYRFEL